MGSAPWDNDHSPDMSDNLDFDPKLKDLDIEGQARRVPAVDSSSTSESVGRQIEMESENTIKYRTCSWQKVGRAERAIILYHQKIERVKLTIAL